MGCGKFRRSSDLWPFHPTQNNQHAKFHNTFSRVQREPECITTSGKETMWIAYFCGFDGLAILRRLKKQPHNENDKQDESIVNDLPEFVKTAEKANVTNIKVLTPEEILELKSDSDAVQTCTATLNEIVITVPHGKPICS